PGVLVPDAPVVLPGAGPTRIRALARDGFLLLAGAEFGPTAAVRVLKLAEIDPEGALTAALGARPEEAWLIRPDAHIAAVLTDPADLPAALARALGSLEWSPFAAGTD
ncbi:pentachlorophenol monooxygenase, partial [Amycolatopsis magusensis]|nr:pentachlorophenol monooxygenase [Amycolatopsis magusensis]